MTRGTPLPSPPLPSPPSPPLPSLPFLPLVTQRIPSPFQPKQSPSSTYRQLESSARKIVFAVNTLENISLLNLTHLKIVLLNLVT